MAEEPKEQSESQQENESEKVDNRLPYQPPKLRKHGKVNDTTFTVLQAPPQFDSIFGPIWADLS
ncbi:MAG: DEAD/DEAH box helicase [Rivularia sp. (in: Bacteria)]|nr:DEAD/DEAH box helicase [Rivularia sp. MS3]